MKTKIANAIVIGLTVFSVVGIIALFIWTLIVETVAAGIVFGAVALAILYLWAAENQDFFD